jgi:hypothetical protein
MQIDPPRLGIDFGTGLLQARAGVLDGQQVGEQRLLGIVPVGLAKRLAGFQFPGPTSASRRAGSTSPSISIATLPISERGPGSTSSSSSSARRCSTTRGEK